MRRSPASCLAFVPVVVLVIVGWQRRWMADDGLIHLRVTEHLLDGHGPVFNAGERVEASTSPMWVLILALARVTHLASLETTAVVLGLLFTGAGLTLAVSGARYLWQPRGSRAALVPVGAAVVAVLPPMWDFATSGLETGLTFFWLGGTFFTLSRLTVEVVPPWPQFRLAVLAASVGPLIRPDLALFTGAFLIAAVALAVRSGQANRGRLVALIALGLALPFVHQAFRMGYYGTLVPTTALAKEASRAWWEQGWRYLLDLVRPYWLWIPLVAMLPAMVGVIRAWAKNGAVSRLLVAAAPVAAGFAHGLYITRVGGDFMHARLLLPSLFAVLMPAAVVSARTWSGRVAVVMVLPWALICCAQLRVGYVVGPEGITDERRFYAITAARPNPVEVEAYKPSILYADGMEARRLSELSRPSLGWRTSPQDPVYASMPLRPSVPFRTAFVASNLGITGVLAGTDVRVVDPSGLADPIASRLRLQARGRPGHEKHLDLAWMIARFADPRAQMPEGVSAPAVQAARNALRCGDLRELQEATSEPLGIGRFFENLGLSLRLHSFQIDPDPITAERQLCKG